ncbi:MAG: TonB-dependent receptor [Myxococcales bacterium]|nr:TonB-dependent receptor [Myxococcales bacterium]
MTGEAQPGPVESESVPTVTDPQGDDLVEGDDLDEVEAIAAPPAPTGPIQPPEGYEVIKIKGRAVSGIETDVPESVTQFDAESIAALGAGNIADLAKVTPNVEIVVAGATAATFFIRGVGLADFSANAVGAVAIYKDDIVMNSPAIQLGLLFDLRAVDFILGPAGIGPHRNASAGAIKLYGNKPTLEYAARVKQSVGSFWSKDARDAFIRDTEGFINLPLIDEMLAMRVAFRVSKVDPFMTNGCGDALPFADRIGPPLLFPPGMNPAAVCSEGLIRRNAISPVPENLPKKVGGRGAWAARGALRLQPPGTDMDWLVSFHGSRLDQDSTLGQAIGVGGTIDALGGINSLAYWEPDTLAEYSETKWFSAGVTSEAQFRLLPAADRRDAENEAKVVLAKNLADRPLDRNPYRGDYNRVGKTTLDIWGGHLRGEFSLGRIDVTTITGFETYERFRDQDRDFTPDSLFEAISTDEAKQFTQEFNLSGQLFDSAVRWNLGASFIQEKLHSSRIDFQIIAGGPLPFKLTTKTFVFDVDQNTSSYMTYGDFTWDFLEDFSLQMGARLNVEKKDFHVGRTSQAGFLERDRSERWSEPTGKIALSYHVSDAVTLHTKYTRGYKAGHFNSGNVDFKVAAKPEFVDAFEWSLNLNAFESRFIARAGFFFYKYKDYQVFLFTDEPAVFNTPKLVIVNASRVQQYGSEVNLTLKPLQDWAPELLDGLKLAVEFGWLASEYLDFTNIVFRTNVTGGNIQIADDFSGNQLINSPKFKVSGNVEWPLDFGEWGEITPRYGFIWVDDLPFDASKGRGSPGLNFTTRETFDRLPKHAVGQKAHWIHNVRLSYKTPMRNVEISAWVRNVLDARYKTYAFDVSNFFHTTINYVGDPRSFGVDMVITW